MSQNTANSARVLVFDPRRDNFSIWESDYWQHMRTTYPRTYGNCRALKLAVLEAEDHLLLVYCANMYRKHREQFLDIMFDASRRI